MRQRNKPWAKDKLESYPDLVIKTPADYRGGWQKVFGNDEPIHVEIGTGKGRFITEMATKNPTINYIGVELRQNVLVTALDKCIDARLANVRLLHVDARELEAYFSFGEVERLYLNFSDPWEKKRHEKRRLTFKHFLKIYQHILEPKKGEIYLKTDNPKLCAYSLLSFNNYGMKLIDVSLDLKADNDEANVLTEYELKFMAQGKPIYRIIATF